MGPSTPDSLSSTACNGSHCPTMSLHNLGVSGMLTHMYSRPLLMLLLSLGKPFPPVLPLGSRVYAPSSKKPMEISPLQAVC